MAHAQAYAARSIRNIKTELSFLHETGALRPSDMEQILSLLPSETSSSSVPAAQNAVFTPTTTSSYAPTPPPSTHAYPAPPRSPLAAPVPIPVPAPAPHAQTYNPPAPAPAPVASPQPPTYTPTPLVLSHAEAMWAFQGSETGDLSFPAGATIEVVEKVKADWWRGRVLGGTGEIGLFPSSYVKETQPMTTGTPALPPRKMGGSVGYGAGGNPVTDVAYGSPVPPQQGVVAAGGPEQPKEKNKFQKNGEKVGKKLGNAAIFGAGATMGSNLVNSIF